MRIECSDIQKALSGILRKKGFCVIARESVEGAKKPCCGVDALPASAENLNDFIEEDTFSAAVFYYPRLETQEELLTAADRLRRIILYLPLEINGRVISTNKVEFSKQDNVLIAEADYVFEQEAFGDNEDDELMKNLEFDTEILA